MDSIFVQISSRSLCVMSIKTYANLAVPHI